MNWCNLWSIKLNKNKTSAIYFFDNSLLIQGTNFNKTIFLHVSTNIVTVCQYSFRKRMLDIMRSASGLSIFLFLHLRNPALTLRNKKNN